jgi:hypothetical protein
MTTITYHHCMELDADWLFGDDAHRMTPDHRERYEQVTRDTLEDRINGAIHHDYPQVDIVLKPEGYVYGNRFWWSNEDERTAVDAIDLDAFLASLGDAVQQVTEADEFWPAR